VSLSETFDGLDYKRLIYDVGAIAHYYKGWSYREIMNMSPRERRHWIAWADALIAREKPPGNDG